MTTSKIAVLFFWCLTLNMSGQMSWTEAIPPKAEVNYKNYAAILSNGVPLWDGESNKGPLTVLNQRANLTVNAVDRKTNEPIEGKTLPFMIAVKDYDTNTVWMLSDKVYSEVNMEDLKDKCSFGDVILFITLDRTYRLPRHELSLNNGC